MSDLLPWNATKQEIAMAGTMERLSALPVEIGTVWNPDTCPVSFLPWLAWAMSVDSWNPSWTEAQKRAIVKNSLYIHKHKGTIGAMRRAMESIGYTFRIVEWFDQSPQGDPYTFKVEIGISGRGIEERLYTEIEQIVRDAKNVRSQMSLLQVVGEVRGPTIVGIGMVSGEDTTVGAFFLETLQTSSGVLHVLCAMVSGEICVVSASDWSIAKNIFTEDDEELLSEDDQFIIAETNL
jgi:phage tail P2-like protein